MTISFITLFLINILDFFFCLFSVIICNVSYLFSGMHFSQSVAIIQSQVGVIRGVQVLYSDVVNEPCLFIMFFAFGFDIRNSR